jgi:hypothetical protein
MDLRKDIYFYADLASFPASGAANLLYVDSATSLIYIWNGASYVASGAGGLKYGGLWNADTNNPTITSGVGDTGEYYIVGTAGTTNIDGINDWAIGDWIIFGGSAWQKIDNSDKEGYNTIEDEGTPLTQRSTINFVGSGVTAADSGGKTVVTIAAGGLTEFTELETTAAPNATVPVNSLTPVTATTNADFAVKPKGTGAILGNIPDNTATGGNKRGAGAVDLQLNRASASQVASGTNSFVAGISCTASGNQGAAAIGDRNVSSGVFSFSAGGLSTASNQGSTALGQQCTASALYAFTVGLQNTSSGQSSFSSGGESTASSQYSFVHGYKSAANGESSFALGNHITTNSITGRFSRGYALGAGFVAQGETQKSDFFLSKRTTNNTATTVTVAGGAASTTNQVILLNNSAYRFKGTIIGKQSGSTNVAAWDVDGIIVRGANAAATTLPLGNVTLVQNTPAWGTPTLAADTTNGGLQVQVIGAAATNIQWTAIIETTEVIYA